MKNMLFALCLACCCTMAAHAQDTPTVNISAEARVGYYYDALDGETLSDRTGFKGDYLNIAVNGTLNQSISFAWRQRMNKKISESDFFDATDWMYLTYQANRNWSVAAGKQVVLIGGYEYDRAPIDIFYASEYWNHIACYQFGGSGTYTTGSGRDKLTFQFCESPFRYAEAHNLFAYNLFWAGHHGPWQTLYSANLFEYAPHKFISYLSLGNRLSFGKATLELDFMNRATNHQTYLFKDCSVVAELACFCRPWLNVYTKFTYDVNHTDSPGDQCVLPGTELTTFGGGFDLYPLKGKRDIRLNACVSYTTGTNSNPNGVMVDDLLKVFVGLTWRLPKLSFGK